DLMAHKNTIIRKFDRSKFLRTAILLLGLFLGSFPSGRNAEETIYAFMLNPYITNPEVFYHIIGSFLVIMVLLDSRRMQKIFSHRYLLFLGEISFAMYLLHFIILGSFSSFIFLKLAPYFTYTETFLISFFVSVAFIFLTSYLMYVLVDKKAVQLSHKLYERLFK
ncbi:MAG: acyltransferase, partial [Candidatus Moraniibacteriota bacterium]